MENHNARVIADPLVVVVMRDEVRAIAHSTGRPSRLDSKWIETCV